MIKISRHKTALHRENLSLPIRFAISKSLLRKEHTLLDYGCGHGDDVALLKKNGFKSTGWDPYYYPKRPRKKLFDFVNLGFVLNVIEDPHERKQTLVEANTFSKKVTLISCMLAGDMNQKISKPFSDGFVSSNNTFQKYYLQSELKNYIASQLDGPIYALGPGVFALIKDPNLLEDFEYINIANTTDQKRSDTNALKDVDVDFSALQKKQFASRKIALSFISKYFQRHARFPSYEDLKKYNGTEISRSEFKLALLKFNSGLDKIAANHVTERVRNELLQKFSVRKFVKLRADFPVSDVLRKDIRNIFKTQKALHEAADTLLYELGNYDLVLSDASNAVEAQLGLLLDSKFICHSRNKSKLPIRLQALLNLASFLSGNHIDTEIYQIHLETKKVSMLTFHDFKLSALPKLKTRTKVDFRSFDIEYVSYSASTNIRVIAIRSPFLSQTDPTYEKQNAFEREMHEKTKLLHSWRTWTVREIFEALQNEQILIPNFNR